MLASGMGLRLGSWRGEVGSSEAGVCLEREVWRGRRGGVSMSEMLLVLVQVERECRREWECYLGSPGGRGVDEEEIGPRKESSLSNLFEEQAGVSDAEGSLERGVSSRSNRAEGSSTRLRVKGDGRAQEGAVMQGRRSCLRSRPERKRRWASALAASTHVTGCGSEPAARRPASFLIRARDSSASRLGHRAGGQTIEAGAASTWFPFPVAADSRRLVTYNAPARPCTMAQTPDDALGRIRRYALEARELQDQVMDLDASGTEARLEQTVNELQARVQDQRAALERVCCLPNY